MKTILLVGLAAAAGVLAVDYLMGTEFVAKQTKEWESGTTKAVKIGATAGVGALTFGLLARFV